MKDLSKIRRLVGEITQEQLVYVDCAVSDTVGVFMPVAGQCKYATQPEHTHPGWSFIVSFDSSCATRIGGKIINSVPSTTSVLPPAVPHQELPSESVARYIAVMVDRDYFDKQLSVYNCPGDIFNPGSTCTTNRRLVDALKEFLTEYEEAAPGYEQLLAAAGLTITHLIIRQFLFLNKKQGTAAYRMSVTHAIEYCNAHYGEKISVSDLAMVANCSESHFSRIFREETSMSPVDYLMHVRLDCAKRMLRVNEKTVTEIALSCGFGSSSYFSQCFTKKFKTSPSDFRKRILSVNESRVM